MKKKFFALATVLMTVVLLLSCTDSLFINEALSNTSEMSSSDEVNALIEKARWGDGKAFLQLADCYRDGKGVKKDFTVMLTMAAQAEEFCGITCMEDYMKSLPERSDFRLIYESVEKCTKGEWDEANSMIDQLMANGNLDGHVVKGIFEVLRGDTLEGFRLMKQAAQAGSSFGELMLFALDNRKANHPDTEKLSEKSEKIPFFNSILAEIYAGFEEDSLKNESLAAYYFMKADEKAYLGRRGASWLLRYNQKCNLRLSEQDIQRLRILAGIDGMEEDQLTCKDKKLEASVSLLLQEKLEEYQCSKGTVYVVETATGAIKAQASLANNRSQFVPYEDTFNDEQRVLMKGPAYLAMLSTGKISPDQIIDTGSGIYKDVRDSNWQRVGYGQLTFEKALGFNSLVAFAIAKDFIIGNDVARFEKQISGYLSDMPNDAMGLLTFYNAVANGGCMVKLKTEGDDVSVLNEQIEEKEHIISLQKALHHAVSKGLFRKAGRSYTTVAACGRSFKTEEDHYRMELCGYFPADHPLFTMMVILEKDNYPASVNGMCGPIMANTIDLLVTSYDLKPLLVCQDDEFEEEVVDSAVVGLAF